MGQSVKGKQDFFVHSDCLEVHIVQLWFVFVNYIFIFSVHTAKLTGSGGLFSSRPDCFLELSVDHQPPRKTEVCKKTSNPKWEEHFTV